ncbi:uncharacterized protein LOC131075056 [Cryptomeria japonica]|uniref:uncharacterized protein LOC131075056 n=1 Tax=Cryptomeria japonica TaxID=3369 RepID=UPI0027D9DD5A|nr:uncharacterized protein LOC131075056 [Cryptomeria japonica]
MRGKKSEAQEDEGVQSSCVAWWDDEDEQGVPVSPEHDDGTPSASRNPRERIQFSQSYLQSALKDLYKQFDDMKADLDKTEEENMQLVEKNEKLKERLNRAKDREKSLKKDLAQSQNKLRQICTTVSAVKEECDKICDQQEADPQLSKSKKYVLKVLEVNNLLNCSICSEPWTESGDHTACSLPCGHFFGRLCITQWILGNEKDGSARCPQCSKGATLSDIRNHCVSQIYEGADEA